MPCRSDFTTGPSVIPKGSLTHLQDIGADSVGCQRRLQQHCFPLVAYDNGGEQTVFAFGEEANQAIFTDTDTYHVYGPPGPRNSSHRRFLNGLFGLNGAKHLEHRRLLMPNLRKDVVLSQ